ncbi:hypothetical protein ACR3K2_31400 [Cryptosporidium serpentis]
MDSGAEDNDNTIIVDGETVIDDLLLASKFAELENSRLELITQAYNELRKGNISKVKNSGYYNKHENINKELQDILNNDFIASENKKFITTDNEGSENEDGNLDSNTSTESDNEIQELIKREMKYRGQMNNNEKQVLLNTDDTFIDLSSEYLENFGLKVDDKNKCDELSDYEYEDDYDSRNVEFKNQDKNINNLINSTCIPYIEIIDLPSKVDSELPCEFIGNIFSLVDNLLFDDEIYEKNTKNKKLGDNNVNDNNKNSIIMVRGDPNSSMLDLGSVVCLEDKTIIGVVVDTFGPINSPFYAIRKQNDFIQDLNIGDRIFCDVKHSTFLGKAGEIQFSYLKNNMTTNINGNNLSPVNEDLDDDTEEDKCETSEYFDSKGKSKFFQAGKFKEKYEEAGIQIADYDEIKKPINNNISTCMSSTSRNNAPRSKKLSSFNNTNSKQYGLNSKSVSINYNRNTKYGSLNHKRSSDNRSIQYLGQYRRNNYNYRKNQTPNNNYSSHVNHYNQINHNNLFGYHEVVNYPNNSSTISNLNYPNLQNQQHMVMFGNQQPILGYQFLPQNQSIIDYQYFASPEQFLTNSNTTNQYQQAMQSFYIPIGRDTNSQVQIHPIQQFNQDNRNNNHNHNNHNNNHNNHNNNHNNHNNHNNNI